MHPPPRQLGDLVEHCKVLGGVRAEDPATRRFGDIWSLQTSFPGI